MTLKTFLLALAATAALLGAAALGVPPGGDDAARPAPPYSSYLD